MIIAAVTVCFSLAAPIPQNELDTDGDGLSDFKETHTYLTNPTKSDSDGDGTPDGDWNERREYNYSLRSVSHVMKPVTIDFLSDDYQDARILDEGENWVELEVVHYPFNTVAQAVGGAPIVRPKQKSLMRWMGSGPTSNWSPFSKRKLAVAMRAEGIDYVWPTDRAMVENVVPWLLQHAKPQDGFTTFLASFDRFGKPFVRPELASKAQTALSDETLEAQWNWEISSTGAFEHKKRGSCTSTAIYLTGHLRSLGIPTRIVLCIPLIDASDARERALASARIQHHDIRRIVMAQAERTKASWTSHTFNEVWIEDRWVRLNYDRLGQNILDETYLGLMTHIATFADWSEANIAETVGRREQLPITQALFGGPNPYSTIAISDRFGRHSRVDNPEPEAVGAVIAKLHWTDSDTLPADIVSHCQEKRRVGWIAEIPYLAFPGGVEGLLQASDPRIQVQIEAEETRILELDRGCWWRKGPSVYVFVPFASSDWQALYPGQAFHVRPLNFEGMRSKGEVRWTVECNPVR